MKDEFIIWIINQLFKLVSPRYTRTLEALIREGMMNINPDAYKAGKY